jgi:hypothetical protein
MKLRLRAGSLRLRLSQGEVRRFAETGEVEETVSFGPARSLTYRLVKHLDETVTVRFEEAVLTVAVPTAIAEAWVVGAALGFEATVATHDGGTLFVLVEKDLACLTPRPHEDDSDAFPNPKTSCGDPG